MDANLQIATAVFIFTSLLRSFLEITLVPVTSKGHDAVIRALALLLGVLMGIVVYAVNLPAHMLLDGRDAALHAWGGFQSALLSIGTYHVVTSNFFDNQDSASLTVGEHSVTVKGKNAEDKLKKLTGMGDDSSVSRVLAQNPMSVKNTDILATGTDVPTS